MSNSRRNHRIPILNRIEVEIEKFKGLRQQGEEYISLWKSGEDRYKKMFSTSETWQIMRERHQTFEGHKAIWFKHSTPKFSFWFGWL